MVLTPLILLLFSLFLKTFPPKKPNPYYGYMLGNATKSDKHWEIANKYAPIYSIILCSLLIFVNLISEYLEYDAGILIITMVSVGFATIYILLEKKMKSKIN